MKPEDSLTANAAPDHISWLIDKLALLVPPAITYYWALCFEKGYCGAFGVAEEFVHVSPANIAVAFAAMFGSFLILLPAIDTWAGWGRNPKSTGIISVIAITYGLGFFLIHSLSIVVSFHEVKIWYISLIALLVLDLFQAAIRKRSQPFLSRLIAPIIPARLYPNARWRLGPIFPAAILALIGGGFATSWGHQQAVRKTDFLMESNSSGIFVVRWYEDKIICSQFDPQTKKLTGKIWLISTGDTSAHSFEHVNAGPLNIGDL